MTVKNVYKHIVKSHKYDDDRHQHNYCYELGIQDQAVIDDELHSASPSTCETVLDYNATCAITKELFVECFPEHIDILESVSSLIDYVRNPDNVDPWTGQKIANKLSDIYVDLRNMVDPPEPPLNIPVNIYIQNQLGLND